MASTKYSLAKYRVAIVMPASIRNVVRYDSIVIGGEGSYNDSITVSRSNDLWSTSGDFTGSHVHNKNLDSTGTVTFSLNQVSSQIAVLKNIFNIYYKSDVEDGLTVTVSDSQGNTVATCNDCLVQNIPEQAFGNEATTQTWTLTCGEVIFN